MVFTPVLTIVVGVDGNVHVGVSMGATQVATVTSGLRYRDGSWMPIQWFTNSFSYKPPTLLAGLDLKGYAGSRIALLLYGVAGPYATVQAYVKLEADIFATPWWILYGGLEVPVGVRVEILSHVLADYEAVVIGAKQVIAQAPSTAPWFSSPPARSAWAAIGRIPGEMDIAGRISLPLHTVYLDAYRIGRTEVTNARYTLVRGGRRVHATGLQLICTRPYYYGNAIYDNYPVINVTWYQAVAYCTWIGGRLPSEAEWEKAPRGASDTHAYPWGDGSRTAHWLMFTGPARQLHR